MKEATWPLQDAKNRLSELVDRAKAGIPQIITRRGKQEVVVIGIEDFKKISAREQDLVSFLRSSPLVGVDLEIERDDDAGRVVTL
jgi:antitoxin Phd